jgi:hypothetical protein
MISILQLLCVLTTVHATDPVGPYLPWGIHMAYGSDPTTSMSFMWSTRSSTRSSTVYVTSVETGQNSSFVGTSFVYNDSNNIQSIHTTFVTGLEPGGHYSYTVGDEYGNRSSILTFNLHPVNGGSWRGGREYLVTTSTTSSSTAVTTQLSLPI